MDNCNSGFISKFNYPPLRHPYGFPSTYGKHYLAPSHSYPVLSRASIRQVSEFQHGPERLEERPPHTQHIDWHDMYPTEVVLSGPTNLKRVALTFDDGPDTKWTPQILDVLGQYGVKGTFACVGQQVQLYPQTIQHMFQEGHNIENHSWNHPNFTKIPLSEAREQIEQTNTFIKRIIGVTPRFFRPPYGAMNNEVIHQVISLGMKILYWDVDSLDWSGITAKQTIANVLAHTAPGSIILMHFAGGRGGSLEDTVKSLPSIIRTLHKEGYTFTTVAKLLGISPYLTDR